MTSRGPYALYQRTQYLSRCGAYREMIGEPATMKVAIRYLVLLVLQGFVAGISSAQNAIWVSATADDSVGRQLVFELKEGIRRSAAMRLVDRSQDAQVFIHLVTMDPDRPSGGGNRTIYSVVWTVQSFHANPLEVFLTTQVGICGYQRASACAGGLVATTDEQVSDLRRALRDLLDSDRMR